jgi:hypothetical protein
MMIGSFVGRDIAALAMPINVIFSLVACPGRQTSSAVFGFDINLLVT